MTTNPLSKPVLKRIGIVTVGNIVSAGLGLVLLTILARALSPIEFAIAASIVAIIDGGQLLLDGTFNAGIVTVAARDGQTDRPSAAALRAGFVGKVVGGIVLAAVISLLSVPLSVGFVGDASIAIPLICAGAAAVVAATQSFLITVLQTRGLFAKVALASTLKNLLRVGAVLPLILAGSRSGTAVSLAICGATVATVVLSARLTSWDFLRDRTPLKGELLKQFEINGWMIVVAVSVFGGRLDIWIVSLLSDAHQAGLYAVAAQLCVGVGIINQAIITSLLPSISRLQRSDDLLAFARQWLRCAPLVVLLGFFAWPLSEPVIRLLFGSAYAPSASVFLVLFAASLTTIIGNPLLMMLLSTGNARSIAAVSVAQLGLRLVFAFALVPSRGALGIAVADFASRLLIAAYAVYLIRDTMLSLKARGG